MSKWDESKHPRHPAGSPQGGEFKHSDDPYWNGQIEKHLKAAATFRKKFKQTAELRWAKQAATNEKTASSLLRRYGVKK